MKRHGTVPTVDAARGTAVLGRVSTDESAKSESVPNQIEYCRRFWQKYLAEDTNKEVHEFREEGISGKTMERKAIKSILELAKNKRIRYLVVFDVSRFSRNTEEGLAILRLLVTYGVDVKVADEPTLDFGTNEGVREWTRQLADATYERSKSRAKAIFGMTKRAARGDWKGGPPPYGLRRHKKTLKHDGNRARLIRELGKAFTNTQSVMGTLEYFEKNELLVWPAPPRRKRRSNLVLTKKFIDSVLRNPVYAGYVPAPQEKNKLTEDILPALVYNGRPYFNGNHPAIFEPKLWDKIQDILDRPKLHAGNAHYRRGADDYLLQGLVTCGCCGKKFTDSASKNNKGGGNIHSYVCQSYNMLGSFTSCKNRRLPGEATEMAVIKALAGLAHHPEMVAKISSAAATGDEKLVAASRARVTALEKERAQIKRAIANAAEYICANKKAALAKVLTAKVEKLSAKNDAITGELVGLEEKISNATAALPAPDKIAQALAKFEELVTHLPAGRLKQLIGLLVEDIKADKILDRNHPLYRGLARSSLLVRLTISLSAIGVRFVAQTPTALLASIKNARPRKKSIATIPVVFEIRACGSRGNSVHIIDPTALDSKVVAFALDKKAAKSSVNAVDQKHPIYLAKKAAELRSAGKLKKDIAATLNFSAGYVSYLFRILDLPQTIQDTLADPLNAHLRAWIGIARLIKLTHEEEDRRPAVFDEMCRQAPTLVQPVARKK